MGMHTKIEYCDSTCNPVPFCKGCELYSPNPALNHCYAATLNRRYAGRPGWPETFQTPTYFLERIEKALRWDNLTGKDRKEKPWLNGMPRIIFLNDTGDGFSPLADPKVWLEPYLGAMAASPHVWLFLTKWPGRMANYFWSVFHPTGIPKNFILGTTVTGPGTLMRAQKLSSLQLSVGCADTKLWLSLEPLLEQVSLRIVLEPFSWVAAGGESGANARPTHPDAFRNLRDECQALEIPFFFKQWGEWLPIDDSNVYDLGAGVYTRVDPSGKLMTNRVAAHSSIVRDWGWHLMKRVGKKNAGRELDGKTYSDMPDISDLTCRSEIE